MLLRCICQAWVSRRNSMRKGVYISDFQELELPEDGDIAAAAVAAAVLPGGRRLVQDDVLGLPAQRLVQARTQQMDGQEMLYLEFPSETVTRSGYNIRRKNFAAAAVKHGKLYTITASARSDQFNEEKKQLLQHIIGSFRLR
ncbi:hypothetical protein COO60DRAFT_1474231 [Scenedesmus sp. NREL 46B-D3]|nr:hypothetical protein COO60DRAFT_1474231 [Scenedesmus sp. NREL 46B-D3]